MKKEHAKNNYIHIRVSDEQKRNIQKIAEKQNKSITEYVLQSIDNMTEYDNLVNYVKEKILYYNSVNNIEFLNAYLDIFMKMKYKHF